MILKNDMQTPVYIKSKIEPEQLENHILYDSDGVELQLFSEFESSVNYSELIQNLDYYADKGIKVIHTPFQYNATANKLMDLTLEDFIFREKSLLHKILNFAEQLAVKTGVNILIVFHLHFHYDEVREFEFIDTYTEFFKNILEIYPHLEYCIENLTLFLGQSANPYNFYIRGNYSFSAAQLVSTLRARLGTTRIGTVLDICHVGIMNKIVDCIYSEILTDTPKPDFSFRKYFVEFQSTLKLIHLAYFSGTGYGKGHGVPFTSENEHILKEVLDLYKEYHLDCPITLEVREDDYMDCKNYKQMVSLIKK